MKFLMSISSLSLSSPVWMSWWDKYFAPGDLRHRRQLITSTNSSPPSTTTDDGTPNSIAQAPPQRNVTTPERIGPAHRARRQNALFFGGLTFSLLSLAVTRRTILRKRIAAWPSIFTPSHMHIEPPPGPQQNMTRVEGSLMAIEALGLATLNVCAFFMAGVGGAMMWFDVAEMEDLRGKIREGTGIEDLYGGEVDEEAEKEVESWIAQAFGQQGKEGGGIIDGSRLASEAGRQGVLEKLEELQKEKIPKEEGET